MKSVTLLLLFALLCIMCGCEFVPAGDPNQGNYLPKSGTTYEIKTQRYHHRGGYFDRTTIRER